MQEIKKQLAKIDFIYYNNSNRNKLKLERMNFMYQELSNAELVSLKEELAVKYEAAKGKGLKLDMSRGKPETDQLNLTNDMLDTKYLGDFKTAAGVDVRNYGILDGIEECKVLFADMLGVSKDEIIVGGNSSLQLMYDSIAKALLLGVYKGQKAWRDCGKVKFLCPVPGYDRHFAICESLGIEMINVPMTKDGPDMDMVEKLVASDETIKGIWCVPMYSNPDGVTYSDETVRRMGGLKAKADDFRIYWDNAYCVHHLSDTPDTLLPILEECKKNGKEDMVYIFSSTSKISFPGAGIGVMAASEGNINFIKSQMTYQTIGFDKINQLRHVNYFKNMDGIAEKMKQHREILEPKFTAVLKMLDTEIKPHGIADWVKPNGGYFISFNGLPGTAKRTVSLCKEAGVILTGAGATFPYGRDQNDANIRIAPTFPPVSELMEAMDVFCISARLAAVEMLLAKIK